MRLYHGSTVIVEKPNIEIVNFRTDFGKGFYTTIDYEQAVKWSGIKKQRIEKEESKLEVKRFVNIFEYTEKNSLSILDFKEATEEWLEFVFANRKSEKLLHKFDIVKGPVANDNLYATLRLYERNFISKEETIKALKTYKLVNQISFHTKEALETIEFLKAEEIV